MRLSETEARALLERSGQPLPARPKRRPEPKHPEGTPLERTFVTAWRQLAPSLPKPEREYRFHPEQAFRFDFAWPGAKVAVEMDGKDHQVHEDKWRRDIGKLNLAVMENWVVLHATTRMMHEDPTGFVEQVKTLVRFRILARMRTGGEKGLEGKEDG